MPVEHAAVVARLYGIVARLHVVLHNTPEQPGDVEAILDAIVVDEQSMEQGNHGGREAVRVHCRIIRLLDDACLRLGLQVGWCSANRQCTDCGSLHSSAQKA